MPNYIVGWFEPGRSGSPYSFFCRHPAPSGPYVVLNTKRTTDHKRPTAEDYLVEVEDWTSMEQRVQYARRIVAPMSEVRAELLSALKEAEWERDPRTFQRKLVGGPLKTKFGYFEALYDNGNRSNGMDEQPRIWFKPVRDSSNPYYEVFCAAREHLYCMDEAEIARVHELGRATANLGELMREKHGG